MNLQPRHLSHLALLAAFAVLLNLLEMPIPRPIPWAKPGLANLVSLLTLLFYGFRSASFVVLLRVLISSLITGSFLSMGFLLAISGGFVSLAAMEIMRRWNFSLWSISIAGAITHNLTQLLIAWILLIQHSGVFLFLPFMMVAGIGTGLLIALIVSLLMRRQVVTSLFKNQ